MRSAEHGIGVAIGFAAMIAVTAATAALGGDRHPALALAGYTAAVALVAAVVPLSDALLTALIGWLFLDGFVIGRGGDLGWHGTADLVRLGVPVAAACLVRGIAAYTRHRTARTDPWARSDRAVPARDLRRAA
jgi:hypothetical protein